MHSYIRIYILKYFSILVHLHIRFFLQEPIKNPIKLNQPDPSLLSAFPVIGFRMIRTRILRLHSIKEKYKIHINFYIGNISGTNVLGISRYLLTYLNCKYRQDRKRERKCNGNARNKINEKKKWGRCRDGLYMSNNINK